MSATLAMLVDLPRLDRAPAALWRVKVYVSGARRSTKRPVAALSASELEALAELLGPDAAVTYDRPEGLAGPRVLVAVDLYTATGHVRLDLVHASATAVRP